MIEGGMSEDSGPVYSVVAEETFVVTVPGNALAGALVVVRHFFKNPNPPLLLSSSF
jgi:hypothetical protein